MAYYERLSDKIALEKCEDHNNYIKKVNTGFALKLPILIKSRAITQVLMS